MAELAVRLVKQDRALIPEERRQRIFATARRLEDVAAVDLLALQIAGLAGDAELVLGAVVERLEVGIAQRPIRDRGILRDRLGAVALNRVRARAEVVLVHAPGHGAVMDGAAAGLIAVILHRERRSAGIGVGPPGDGLAFDVGSQILALEIAQLVVRLEVLRGETRAALEPDHLHAGLAELGGEDAARSANADDHNIGFLDCHGVTPSRFFWPATAGRQWARG